MQISKSQIFNLPNILQLFSISCEQCSQALLFFQHALDALVVLDLASRLGERPTPEEGMDTVISARGRGGGGRVLVARWS